MVIIITIMKKLERAAIFKNRLLNRISEIGMSRSELARRCGVDRSTIAQLLNSEDVRLPNAHLAAECAAALQVSSDWLLGLTERVETSAGLLSTVCEIADAERTPADSQILLWHQEAAGNKIRHVPATFPDILKTKQVLAFEYANDLDKTPRQAVNAMEETIQWLDAPGSDYEICIPTHTISSLVHGVGYWEGLSADARKEQVDKLIDTSRNRYPSLRIYLIDTKKIYTAPITVFGQFLAVVYVGRYYLVFRERLQIQALTKHFDHLIRAAEVDARSVGDWVENLG